MADEKHIDLETMDKYLQGKLAGQELEAVRRHIESCPICGLEVKRLRRFDTIDSDEELARKGEWLYARMKLEKAFRERIAPGATSAGARTLRRARIERAARWLVPAAAAAALVFVVARFAMNEKPGAPQPGKSVMRGAPPVVYGIDLKEPMGEIKSSPRLFRWESQRKDHSYTLEIFTPTLERIYQARNIKALSWAAPDTLKTVLKSNIVYLWNVRGYKGLERVTASPNGWFRIKP